MATLQSCADIEANGGYVFLNVQRIYHELKSLI